jgi:hypothetical protein
MLDAVDLDDHAALISRLITGVYNVRASWGCCRCYLIQHGQVTAAFSKVVGVSSWSSWSGIEYHAFLSSSYSFDSNMFHEALHNKLQGHTFFLLTRVPWIIPGPRRNLTMTDHDLCRTVDRPMALYSFNDQALARFLQQGGVGFGRKRRGIPQKTCQSRAESRLTWEGLGKGRGCVEGGGTSAALPG